MGHWKKRNNKELRSNKEYLMAKLDFPKFTKRPIYLILIYYSATRGYTQGSPYKLLIAYNEHNELH